MLTCFIFASVSAIIARLTGVPRVPGSIWRAFNQNKCPQKSPQNPGGSINIPWICMICGKCIFVFQDFPTYFSFWWNSFGTFSTIEMQLKCNWNVAPNTCSAANETRSQASMVWFHVSFLGCTMRVWAWYFMRNPHTLGILRRLLGVFHFGGETGFWLSPSKGSGTQSVRTLPNNIFPHFQKLIFLLKSTWHFRSIHSPFSTNWPYSIQWFFWKSYVLVKPSQETGVPHCQIGEMEDELI